MVTSSQRPTALTVAGLDPTGTAGLAADLRTFGAFGVHGMAVATVVTAQTTSAFALGSPTPSDVVAIQLEALFSDIVPGSTKVAMLWSGSVADVVASCSRAAGLTNLVIDPVLADGEGNRLVEESVDAIYRQRLMPIASVVTPNWVEAGVLLGRDIASIDDANLAASELLDLGPTAVVVTGGARGELGNDVVDVVATADGQRTVKNRRRTSLNVRGSGDTLSSAIAANLSLGAGLDEAIEAAETFTQASIARGLGHGIGSGRPAAAQL